MLRKSAPSIISSLSLLRKSSESQTRSTESAPTSPQADRKAELPPDNSAPSPRRDRSEAQQSLARVFSNETLNRLAEMNIQSLTLSDSPPRSPEYPKRQPVRLNYSVVNDAEDIYQMIRSNENTHNPVASTIPQGKAI